MGEFKNIICAEPLSLMALSSLDWDNILSVPQLIVVSLCSCWCSNLKRCLPKKKASPLSRHMSYAIVTPWRVYLHTALRFSLATNFFGFVAVAYVMRSY